MTRGRQRRPQPVILDLATHPRPYVTVRALARYLETDPRTILRLIHEGALEAVQVGRHWRIPTEVARQKFHVETQRHAS